MTKPAEFCGGGEMMKAQREEVGPSRKMAGKASYGSWLPATGTFVHCLKANTAQVLVYSVAMRRKLVWVQDQTSQGFGCSECQWVINPAGALVGRTIDEMKQTYEAERDKEFAAHDCGKFPRTNKPQK